MTFARNLLASVEDRFGRHPDYLLFKPHCLATFSDPRYSWIYFKRGPGYDDLNERILPLVKEELESMEPAVLQPVQPLASNHEKDAFWAEFDETAESQPKNITIETELRMWSGVRRSHRTANPILAMDAMKADFPRLYKLFRKYSIFPASQNKDERLFSMIGQNTSSLCQSIKLETIEKKVVVGSAITQHGSIFHSNDDKKNEHLSSDEADSF